MPSGKAIGPDRDYQELCRDFLVRQSPELTPYDGDGVDVRVESVGGTSVTYDVLLKGPNGDVVAAECKRWKGGVPQKEVWSFARTCEKLREKLSRPVAGFFFAKTHVQIGGNRVAFDSGIQVVVHPDEVSPSGFQFRYERYDKKRDQRLSHLVRGINETINISESSVIVIKPVDQNAGEEGLDEQ